jgi:hypothetical protein
MPQLKLKLCYLFKQKLTVNIGRQIQNSNKSQIRHETKCVIN